MPVVLGIGLEVGLPGQYQRTSGALGHPQAQQPDRAQAVDVDHVRRVGHHLGQSIVEVLAHRQPDLGARDRDAGQSDFAASGAAGVGVGPVADRGDQQQLVAGGQHLALQ